MSFVLEITFTCHFPSSDFFTWQIKEEEQKEIVRKNYIGGWTPLELENPLNPDDGSAIYDESFCVPETPITVSYEISCVEGGILTCYWDG